MSRLTRGPVLAALLVVAAASLAFATSSQASTVLNLNLDNCSGGCNPGASGTSMGTVTLTQNGTNDVRVTISLVSPLEILNTGLQQTIDFNLLSTPTITATNFTNPLFSLTNSTAGSQHFDGFQNFEYAIQLNTSQGAGGEQPSPLSFDISGSGVTEASFLTDGTGAIAFFGVDVINTASGRTGPIAANTLVSSTPLPGAAVLFGSVLFGGLGVSGWRKRRARSAVSVIA